MTPEPTPSQELLISTKDSHYTLCWGEFVIAAYGTYEVAKEKLDKIHDVINLMLNAMSGLTSLVVMLTHTTTYAFANLATLHLMVS